jgi:hypothetical protein
VRRRERNGAAVERDLDAGGVAHEEVEVIARELGLPRSDRPLEVDLAGRLVAAHLDVRPPADAAQDELTRRSRFRCCFCVVPPAGVDEPGICQAAKTSAVTTTMPARTRRTARRSNGRSRLGTRRRSGRGGSSSRQLVMKRDAYSST